MPTISRRPRTPWQPPPSLVSQARWQRSTAVLVFSSSLSPRTARQIEAARTYHHVPVPVDRLLAAVASLEADFGSSETGSGTLEANALKAGAAARDVSLKALEPVCAAIIRHLSAGEHVLAHLVDEQAGDDLSRKGPGAVPASTLLIEHDSAPESPIEPDSTPQPSIAHDPAALARASGRFLARILQEIRPARLGLAGGDTSSHGVQALPVWGLSYVAPIDPGAALCRLHADDPRFDGLEVMLKGGQMGSDTIFEKLIPG